MCVFFCVSVFQRLSCAYRWTYDPDFLHGYRKPGSNRPIFGKSGSKVKGQGLKSGKFPFQNMSRTSFLSMWGKHFCSMAVQFYIGIYGKLQDIYYNIPAIKDSPLHLLCGVAFSQYFSILPLAIRWKWCTTR